MCAIMCWCSSMSVSHLRVCMPAEPRGIASTKVGVPGVCQSPALGPVGKQYALLTFEPFFPSLHLQKTLPMKMFRFKGWCILPFTSLSMKIYALTLYSSLIIIFFYSFIFCTIFTADAMENIHKFSHKFPQQAHNFFSTLMFSGESSYT